MAVFTYCKNCMHFHNYGDEDCSSDDSEYGSCDIGSDSCAPDDFCPFGSCEPDEYIKTVDEYSFTELVDILKEKKLHIVNIENIAGIKMIHYHGYVSLLDRCYVTMTYKACFIPVDTWAKCSNRLELLDHMLKMTDWSEKYQWDHSLVEGRETKRMPLDWISDLPNGKYLIDE